VSFFIKFKGKTLTVRLSSNGFKMNPHGTKKWEYVSKEDLEKFVGVLNATKSIKLSVCLKDRAGFSFRDEFSIFRNSALLCCILFPECVRLKGNVIEIVEKIRIHEEYLRRRNKLLTESFGKTFHISHKLFEKGANQSTLEKYTKPL